MRTRSAGTHAQSRRVLRLAIASGLAIAALVGANTTAAEAGATLHASAATATPKLVPVKGYTYITAPAEYQAFVKMIKATGYVTGATIKGAKDSNDIQAVVLLAQYNAKITKALDKATLKKVLDGATSGLAAVAGSKAIKDYAVAGTHVRSINLSGVTVLVTYIKTGKLVETFGPNAAAGLKFIKAYLLSAKAHGQKLG